MPYFVLHLRPREQGPGIVVLETTSAQEAADTRDRYAATMGIVGADDRLVITSTMKEVKSA